MTRFSRSALTGITAALLLAAPLAVQAQERPDYRAGNVPVPQIEQEEMAATDVLNALSARGYSQYRQIELVDGVYRVTAMTRDFQVVVIEVDPRTGAIRETPQ